MVKHAELTNPNSCLNRAKDDELLFVILERDEAAAFIIRKWASRRIQIGKNTSDDAQIIEALKIADEIDARKESTCTL